MTWHGEKTCFHNANTKGVPKRKKTVYQPDAMHALIAKHLDLTHLQAALQKQDSSDPHEMALLVVSAQHPSERKIVLEAKSSGATSDKVQAAQLFLLTEAALRCLRDEPSCAEAMKRVEEAFANQGATADEVTPLLGTAILEEALGYADDPDVFDQPFLLETLQSLVPLASVTEDTLEQWVETFSKSGAKSDIALRLTVAQTLFATAWSDGPALIAAETVDDAVESLSQTVAASDLRHAGEYLIELLHFLADQSLIGPTRLERLSNIARSAADAGEDMADEDEVNEDDADDAMAGEDDEPSNAEDA